MKSDNKSDGDFGSRLIDFIKKTLDKYDWHFMGAMPAELHEYKDKLTYHEWKDTWHYPQYVKSINADIGIAPLEFNLFNECKSNIKALEFTACGMPGVYTNIEPYKFMTTKANTEEEMISKIEELASDPELRMRTWEKDYNIVKKQLWWEENDNFKKYINTYLNLMGRKLP
jgi:glycosyltransferase involved in cell wall biosynthesis